MKIFNKNKYPNALFVAVSLISAVVVFGFISVGGGWISNNSSLWQDQKDLTSPEEDPDTGSDIIIRDDNYGDPLINRSPHLEDQISQPIVVSDSISFGNKKAPVTIVQFSDFECKHCKEQERVIRDLVRDEYGEKVRLIWKDYPSVDQNSVSWQASRAARCANKQGDFWQYHDLLYKNNSELGRDLFLSLARETGLNMSSFSECLSGNKEIDERISGNIIEANSLGVTGIPFLYINDKGVMGKINEEQLKKMIEIELNEE